MRVAEHVEQAFQKAGEEVQNVNAGDIVHHVDPGDEQAADVRTRVVNVLLHQRDQLLHIEGLGLGHNLLQQFVQQGGSLGSRAQLERDKDISFTSTSTSA